MLKKTLITLGILSSPLVWSQAIIDPDVKAAINRPQNKLSASPISAIVFLSSAKQAKAFINDLNHLQIAATQFASLPVVLISLPRNQSLLNDVANHPAAQQISIFHGGQEELDYSEKAILLKPSTLYPDASNWWSNGFVGQNSIVGIIDSGIAVEHPSLGQKQIIIRKEPGSGYDEVKNGVRSAHATGVACIYAGSGNAVFPNDVGVAQQAPTIVAGLAGEGEGNMDDIGRTLSTLDWMLSRSNIKPNVINYSYGNGLTNCADCSDWSGLAKVVDYVVNHYHVLWVKSAGNNGYVPASTSAPYAGTMTTPADNYNGLTVANMNPTTVVDGVVNFNPDRSKHSIRYTSSRGPTKNGRKKPDISAPGNDTRTCAPDPDVYNFSYTQAMDYHDGYRLMGGTSSAAPHVGAAVLLLHSAGITSPLVEKALLINAADAYTDNNQAGSDDPKYSSGNHYPVMGSQWNRTYGWGYLNMQKAYDERNNVIEDKLTLDNPQKIYHVDLPVGAKITLVHERRVGYSKSQEWQLSHLSLEIVEERSNRLIMQDDSAQDTVHQVANCRLKADERQCSNDTTPIHALVKVKLLSRAIDGAKEEPFALAASVPLVN